MLRDRDVLQTGHLYLAEKQYKSTALSVLTVSLAKTLPL